MAESWNHRDLMQRTATAALCHSGDVMRCVHYNVRRCVDLSNTCSRERVLSTIEHLRPTLLTLNEVDMRKTPSLVGDLERIGLPHTSFFGHVGDVYGNMLASAVPLRNVYHTHLEGGAKVQTQDGKVHTIIRGLVSASIRVHGVELRVAVTHLDHMSSEERRTQTRHVLRTFDASATANEQCILLGDLNALCRTDYSDAEWVAHERYNAEKGWGAPVDESSAAGVLALLRGANFIDAFAALERPPDWQTPPWSAHVRDRDRPRYRIDYLWTRAPTAPFGGGRQLVPLAGCIEANCSEASDHQPVVVDFEAVAFDAGE